MKKPVQIESSVKVGSFDIQRFTDGRFWIIFEGGEGFQVAKGALEDLIEKFYRENF